MLPSISKLKVKLLLSGVGGTPSECKGKLYIRLWFISRKETQHKGKFQPKIKIAIHKIFLEIHSRTALQYSLKQLVLKWKKKKRWKGNINGFLQLSELHVAGVLLPAFSFLGEVFMCYREAVVTALICLPSK